MNRGGIMHEEKEWELFASPGEVFRFLEKNHACYQIDMNSMNPLNLIEELAYIVSFMKKIQSQKHYKE